MIAHMSSGEHDTAAIVPLRSSTKAIARDRAIASSSAIALEPAPDAASIAVSPAECPTTMSGVTPTAASASTRESCSIVRAGSVTETGHGSPSVSFGCSGASVNRPVDSMRECPTIDLYTASSSRILSRNGMQHKNNSRPTTICKFPLARIIQPQLLRGILTLEMLCTLPRKNEYDWRNRLWSALGISESRTIEGCHVVEKSE